MISRTSVSDPAELHERALAMRYRRFEQGSGEYADLIDIPRHLAALGRYDAVADLASQATRILRGTLATCAYLAEILPFIPSSELAWSRVADEIGDALLLAGNLPAARSNFEAALVIDERLAIANPTSTVLQRNLSISHSKIGDLSTAAGGLSTARDHHQAALDIRQRLAATDPGNTEWQRDLSVSHDNLGDIATATGDLNAARTSYQASLDIRQRLTATDPGNTQWQRDLSVSHDKIGDIARASGDISGARRAYQASLDVITRLPALDPSNAQWRSDVEFTRARLEALPAEAAGESPGSSDPPEG